MRHHKILLFGALSFGSLLPLGLLSPAAFGQFQPPSKEELEMTSDPKAPGAAAVYLYREEREDDPHHFRSVYARIKVLTDAGKDAATVHVSYHKNFVFYAAGDNSSRMANGFANHWDAPDVNHAGEDPRVDTNAYGGHEEVTAIEGRVIHPDGTIVPLSGTPSDLLKSKSGHNQYNDMTFNLPGVEVGSIIEYRYQVGYDRFQEAPEWQVQQPYFVHKAHYVFVPAEQFSSARNTGGIGSGGVNTSAIMGSHGEVLTDIRLVPILPPGDAVKTDPIGNYYVDLTDIPAIPHEAYAPPLGGQIYQVNFVYTAAPDVKDYWQKQMAFWIKDVNVYTAPTELIKSTATEVTAGATTPLDKAKKLYALVEKFENTDALSGTAFLVSDFVPRGSVEEVLQHKSGNSEDLALLFYSLARAAGLEVRPERIASRNHRTFNSQFMDSTQLDSLVIGLTIDGKEIFLDPGEKMAPFQTLHWSHSGAGGVAMAANGKVEVVITPLQLNTDNKIVRVGNVAVTQQGAVSGTLKVGFVGQEAMFLRQLALRSGADKLKDQMERLIASEVPDGVTARIDRVANLDDADKQLVAVVQVTGTLSDHAGKNLVLPRVFFETKENDPFPADDPRVLPIDVHYPSREEEQVVYQLPTGFAMEGTPQNASLKWEENAVYELRSKNDANSIVTTRILARGFTLLDASEYGKLRDFYDKVATTDRQQLVLTAARASN